MTRPYFLPTIAEFAEHSFVSGVIEGTVEGTSTEITSTGSVYTVLTVRTIRGGGLPANSRIRVSELGGVVPLRKVRGTFEGKDWQKPLTEADLNKLVDFGAEDKTHTKPDDRLVMFLSGSDAPYGLLAKLEPNGTSGSYSWPGGRRPKNDWPNTFAADEVDQLFAIKKADLIANG